MCARTIAEERRNFQNSMAPTFRSGLGTLSKIGKVAIERHKDTSTVS